jgi:serine/threonine-protein kinase
MKRLVSRATSLFSRRGSTLTSARHAPAWSSSPRPGSIIGNTYCVLAPLGSGAMGEVLLAEDTVLNRRVAIKFVHPWLLDDRFRERFTAEARAMARVSHPNVLQIHAFSEHEGAPYFVMEFVDGRSLADWLDESDEPKDVDLAIDILVQTCLGVAAIHAANTVHRDLKPSNILLDDQMRPRVADLGLAMLSKQERQGGQTEIVGTPDYMAPETAFPEGIDPALRPRADIYSLGCIAYELLTGRPPFVVDGAMVDGPMAMMLQHAVTPVPPLSALRAGLPPELEVAIFRALNKNPSERTPTVEAFRRDLMAARRGERNPVRILVAEDDEGFRGALEIMLATEFPDAEVECVEDGLEALAAFDRKRPSVAILDLAMPGLDGIELTGLIRSRDPARTIPIIILTASGGPGEWKRLAALGADRFLVKPVVLDDVVAMVRRSLHERSSSVRPTPVT